MDSDAPATEELPDGWEQELVNDFVAEKMGEDENDSEDEDVEPEAKPLITTYSEAMKWTSELKLFAIEKGLGTVK